MHIGQRFMTLWRQSFGVFLPIPEVKPSELANVSMYYSIYQQDEQLILSTNPFLNRSYLGVSRIARLFIQFLNNLFGFLINFFIITPIIVLVLTILGQDVGPRSRNIIDFVSKVGQIMFLWIGMFGLFLAPFIFIPMGLTSLILSWTYSALFGWSSTMERMTCAIHRTIASSMWLKSIFGPVLVFISREFTTKNFSTFQDLKRAIDEEDIDLAAEILLKNPYSPDFLRDLSNDYKIKFLDITHKENLKIFEQLIQEMLGLYFPKPSFAPRGVREIEIPLLASGQSEENTPNLEAMSAAVKILIGADNNKRKQWINNPKITVLFEKYLELDANRLSDAQKSLQLKIISWLLKSQMKIPDTMLKTLQLRHIYIHEQCVYFYLHKNEEQTKAILDNLPPTLRTKLIENGAGLALSISKENPFPILTADNRIKITNIEELENNLQHVNGLKLTSRLHFIQDHPEVDAIARLLFSRACQQVVPSSQWMAATFLCNALKAKFTYQHCLKLMEMIRGNRFDFNQLDIFIFELTDDQFDNFVKLICFSKEEKHSLKIIHAIHKKDVKQLQLLFKNNVINKNITKAIYSKIFELTQTHLKVGETIIPRKLFNKIMQQEIPENNTLSVKSDCFGENATFYAQAWAEHWGYRSLDVGESYQKALLETVHGAALEIKSLTQKAIDLQNKMTDKQQSEEDTKFNKVMDTFQATQAERKRQKNHAGASHRNALEKYQLFRKTIEPKYKTKFLECGEINGVEKLIKTKILNELKSEMEATRDEKDKFASDTIRGAYEFLTKNETDLLAADKSRLIQFRKMLVSVMNQNKFPTQNIIAWFAYDVTIEQKEKYENYLLPCENQAQILKTIYTIEGLPRNDGEARVAVRMLACYNYFIIEDEKDKEKKAHLWTVFLGYIGDAYRANSENSLENNASHTASSCLPGYIDMVTESIAHCITSPPWEKMQNYVDAVILVRFRAELLLIENDSGLKNDEKIEKINQLYDALCMMTAENLDDLMQGKYEKIIGTSEEGLENGYTEKLLILRMQFYKKHLACLTPPTNIPDESGIFFKSARIDMGRSKGLLGIRTQSVDRVDKQKLQSSASSSSGSSSSRSNSSGDFSNNIVLTYMGSINGVAGDFDESKGKLEINKTYK